MFQGFDSATEKGATHGGKSLDQSKLPGIFVALSTVIPSTIPFSEDAGGINLSRRLHGRCIKAKQFTRYHSRTGIFMHYLNRLGDIFRRQKGIGIHKNNQTVSIGGRFFKTKIVGLGKADVAGFEYFPPGEAMVGIEISCIIRSAIDNDHRFYRRSLFLKMVETDVDNPGRIMGHNDYMYWNRHSF
ncbi:MAG: hypothetical protein VR65_21820 [Desulfobulbaceae bacterium BRH_c16a]|nr:MAG: hypothetical protein VR65_21820 [Desulfobulbaceae bacterium BRH_c16a]